MKEHGASCFPPDYDNILDFYIFCYCAKLKKVVSRQTDTKIVHARFYLGKALAPFWFILTPLIEVAVVFLRSNPFLAPFL